MPERKISPGQIITLETFGAAIAKLIALLSCNLASTFPNFLRISDLLEYTNMGNGSVCFFFAILENIEKFLTFFIALHLTTDILYVNGDISQKSFLGNILTSYYINNLPYQIYLALYAHSVITAMAIAQQVGPDFIYQLRLCSYIYAIGFSEGIFNILILP